MSKRHSVSVALAASAGFLVAVAGASFARGHGGGLLERFDTDGDGKVNVVDVEVDAAKRAAEIDSNRDGSVTTTELRAYREKQRELAAAKRLAKLDHNGDGKVSVDEFASAHTARLAKLDANSDGSITREEMSAGRHDHGHRRHREAHAE